ncbi:MAG: DUF2933 domain-containing protein [Deltaproteobacteria bacterium]|nr:DUF2933 domain-containing protein [Deltaproteobacteria bacterium]
MVPKPPQKSRESAGEVTFGHRVIGAFFLVIEYVAHLFGVLPYLLVLLCPLLHLLLGGHGGGHSHRREGGAP